MLSAIALPQQPTCLPAALSGIAACRLETGHDAEAKAATEEGLRKMLLAIACGSSVLDVQHSLSSVCVCVGISSPLLCLTHRPELHAATHTHTHTHTLATTRDDLACRPELHAADAAFSVSHTQSCLTYTSCLLNLQAKAPCCRCCVQRHTHRAVLHTQAVS